MTRISLASAFVCVFAVGCSEGVPATPTSASTVTPASIGEDTSQRRTDPAPVRLVQGSIEVGPWYDRQSATLRGTGGFTFDAVLGNSEYPGEICRVSDACRPQATVPLSGQWGGLDLSGTVRWRGETITNVGVDTGAFMSLSGSFVAPAQAETATIVTPFTLTGFIETSDGTRVSFEGTGTATMELQWDESFASWSVIGSRFVFQGAR